MALPPGAVLQDHRPPSPPPPPHTRAQQAGCRQLSLPTSLQNIFAWCGGKSNILERNKARDLALAIRDSERQGKAQVEIVTDGEEPAEMIQVGERWGGQPGEAVGRRVVRRGGWGWGWGWVVLGYCLGLWLLTGCLVRFRIKCPSGWMDQCPGRWTGLDPALTRLCWVPLCRTRFASPRRGSLRHDGLGRSGADAQESLETWPAVAPLGPGPQASSEGGQPRGRPHS